ncbi:hypothetical protein CR513_08954, partial [Mucuna pruriens]
MDKSVIDVASGGALMSKTLATIRNLISNMVGNTQQFGVRRPTTSRGVNEVIVANNQRLDKVTKLLSLVRQLVIRQHHTSLPTIVSDICTSIDHPTNSCHTCKKLNRIVLKPNHGRRGPKNVITFEGLLRRGDIPKTVTVAPTVAHDYKINFEAHKLKGRRPAMMLVTRNQATSSINDGKEHTSQWLLQVVASLQARNEEQSRLNAKAEQHQMQAEERHRLAEERYRETLKMTEEREEELQRQLVAVKATMEKSIGSQSAVSPSAFWAQPFSEEIDQTPIPQSFREDPHTHLQAFQTQMYTSGGDDRLSCKLFPRTIRGVAMHWLATLPPQSIRTFSNLATSFASQFAANKTKCLEVADLFDIKQSKGETLKNYLARFNNAMVRVNDPDKKFFVKAFQKELRAGQFSNSLALRKSLTMEEIRAQAEKHIEVEEDQADRLEMEKQLRTNDTRPT